MPAPILIEFNGKIASIRQHCIDLGVSVGTVSDRHRRTGESYVECLKYYQKYGVNYKVKDRRLYSRWHNMMSRCYNPKNPNYPRYGGRKPKPIKVCDRWQNYKNFEEDLLESFLEHVEQYGISETTLDRYPNKEGNYEPANIRWATRKEQANNLTTNYMITEDLTIAQFAEKYRISREIIKYRLENGMTVEEIINTPVSKHNSGEKPIYVLPCNISLSKHCNKNGYCYNSVLNYISNCGLKPHEALAKYLQTMSLRNIHYLPCGVLLKHHCIKNNYSYDAVTYYIRRYNLQPHQALAKYLEKRKKNN